MAFGLYFLGGIGIGDLGVLILQYLTGGAWGVVIGASSGNRERFSFVRPVFSPIRWRRSRFTNGRIWSVETTRLSIIVSRI